jgi:hypothetical protein
VVQLTGFVAAVEGAGFRLARYQIACCAADAAPVVVRVVGVEGSPPRPGRARPAWKHFAVRRAAMDLAGRWARANATDDRWYGYGVE